ncbi:gamma-glutamylcyclotransferase family protein [Mucilaginibacter boryungensis]|uniref:Gamma-glutamylcyclotransferase n=1 Tax=Mucilaginibacter boryungensis TaxID=768480 RepID=A0ABR9XHX8_9SPHI|nr:gamma-glutamylcyclotransferase family protein [Mucilaginibacter boryungensis]MBE9666619.1 gamma-glutamylcyclotransferase [Mucilaginibacter boryungensis]
MAIKNACRHMFIYGTLLSADNDFGAYLKKNSTYISPGSFSGLLYDMDEYPGAVHKPGITNRVYGNIILLNDDPSVLQTIDEYEGYGKNEEQPNLFVRELVPVETALGVINCWVYLYNRAIVGYPKIVSGRYQ